MAKKVNTNNAINPQLVLAMATLVLILAGLVASISDFGGQKQVVVKATTPDQLLLSNNDDIQDLNNDLRIMEMDEVDSELQTLQNLE